jgi:hypothetical protein
LLWLMFRYVFRVLLKVVTFLHLHFGKFFQDLMTLFRSKTKAEVKEALKSLEKHKPTPKQQQQIVAYAQEQMMEEIQNIRPPSASSIIPLLSKLKTVQKTPSANKTNSKRTKSLTAKVTATKTQSTRSKSVRSQNNKQHSNRLKTRAKTLSRTRTKSNRTKSKKTPKNDLSLI